MCVYDENYFTNYVEKVKDVESEGKDVSHSGFKTNNESINESEMSTV